MRPPRTLVAAASTLAAALLASCSLAGDVTPMPGRSTPPALATRAAVSVLPAELPVSLDGGVIFQARCAPCHGEQGRGDGVQADQLPAPPPDFSTPDFIRQRSPQALYTVVTQGRIEMLMPPFADALSNAERWSAVAYLYTLSTPPDRLERGQAVYEQTCADCHGVAGQGDGPRAAELGQTLPDFSDPAFMAVRSQADLFSSATSAAHDALADVEPEALWEALDALRAFSYAYAPADAVRVERQGQVAGRIINGTPNGLLPAGQPVLLHAFDEQSLLGTLTATTGIDGAFQFDEVPFTAAGRYLATTVYQNVTYASPAVSFGAGKALDLELQIFESTAVDDAISIEQMHLFFEPSGPNEMTVGQLMIFSNSGDRTFSGTDQGGLRIPLPAGAGGLNVQGAEPGRDFFVDGESFTALWVVQPGSRTSQILFSYRLAYDARVEFAQSFAYPVRMFNVLLPAAGLSLQGTDLTNLGPETLGDQQFQAYNGRPLSAGESLAFTVRPDSGAAVSLVNDGPRLAAALAGLALVLIGIGVWVYRRAPATAAAVASEPAVTRDDLLQALAELDDDYQAGTVDPQAYARERAQLKDELRRLWAKDGAS